MNVCNQPEAVSCCNSEICCCLWLEDEDIDEENDVGNVTDKPSHVSELHKPVHLAHRTTERLVTSTE